MCVQHLVGRGNLLAVDIKGHQAGCQVYQAADLQIDVAAAGRVSRAGHIAGPHHVAVTPLHTFREERSLGECFSILWLVLLFV